MLKVLPCERSMSRGWSQSMQTSRGCPEHVSPGHRSHPQMPPSLLGWLLLQLLHLQGGWGTVGPLCGGVQELLFQHVFFEDPPWGLPHLPLQDPAVASNPPKAAGGTPSPHPAAERGWGGHALPSPGLLGTVKETQAPRAPSGRG